MRTQLSSVALRRSVTIVAAVAACVAGCLPGSSATAQLLRLGESIAVSVPDGDSESRARAAADRAGGWGAVWSGFDLDSEDLPERQRRFDRDGAAVEESLREFELDDPDLGLDGEGRGVVVGIRPRPELGGAEVDAACLHRDGSPIGAAVRVDGGDIGPGTRSPRTPRVAMDSDGAFVVAWTEFPQDSAIPPSVFFRRVAAGCTPLGTVESLGAVGVVGQRAPAVAILPTGGFVLTWLEGVALADYRVHAQIFEEGGDPVGSVFAVSAAGRAASSPAVAVGRDGTVAFVWRDAATAPTAESEVVARLFSESGSALGGELVLRPADEANVGGVSISALGSVFVAAWEESGCFGACSGVYARAFDELGALGGALNVNPLFGDADEVEIVALGGAELVVVWTDWNEGTLPADVVAQRIAFLAGGGGCVENATTLCLLDGRFRVEVEWRNFLGLRGAGQSLDLTSDAGLFWFFDPVNLEMLVKMVDACGEFSRRWLFAAATTNVEYTLHVTDTASGRSRSYFNPLGRSSPAITDTDAFDACP